MFVIPLGFEPKTHSLEGCCSIQLSYGTKCEMSRMLLLFFCLRCLRNITPRIGRSLVGCAFTYNFLCIQFASIGERFPKIAELKVRAACGWKLASHVYVRTVFQMVDDAIVTILSGFSKDVGLKVSVLILEFTYTMGKKDAPVKLDTRLMYFDLLNLRQED